MKKLIIATASTALFLLAACSKDSKDFKENAEAFIESTKIETELGTTFSDTTCTEPAKIEAGETFTCRSFDADGRIWNFDLVVRSEDTYEVTHGASFSKEVEEFIEDTAVETQAGTTFTETSCTNPDKFEAGGTLTCTAVDADGFTWDFTVAVDSADTFTITDGQPRGL